MMHLRKTAVKLHPQISSVCTFYIQNPTSISSICTLTITKSFCQIAILHFNTASHHILPATDHCYTEMNRFLKLFRRCSLL